MKWIDAPIGFAPGTSKKISRIKREKLEARRSGKKCNSVQRAESDKVLALIQKRITNTKLLTRRDDGRLTYERSRAVVDGYIKLVWSIRPTYFLTFMPGRKVEPETIVGNTKKFFNRLERKALGRNWSKVLDERIRFIGFLEKPDITPHYQGLAYVPPVMWPTLRKYGSEIWTRLMPTGKFEASLVVSEDEVISYVTKDLHHYWSPQHVAIYKPIPRNA